MLTSYHARFSMIVWFYLISPHQIFAYTGWEFNLIPKGVKLFLFWNGTTDQIFFHKPVYVKIKSLFSVQMLARNGQALLKIHLKKSKNKTKDCGMSKKKIVV